VDLQGTQELWCMLFTSIGSLCIISNLIDAVCTKKGTFYHLKTIFLHFLMIPYSKEISSDYSICNKGQFLNFKGTQQMWHQPFPGMGCSCVLINFIHAVYIKEGNFLRCWKARILRAQFIRRFLQNIWAGNTKGGSIIVPLTCFY
jgi:hypothetical protein